MKEIGKYLCVPVCLPAPPSPFPNLNVSPVIGGACAAPHEPRMVVGGGKPGVRQRSVSEFGPELHPNPRHASHPHLPGVATLASDTSSPPHPPTHSTPHHPLSITIESGIMFSADQSCKECLASL
ncbi:hypothetical protein E2C01_019703 [Portunus trituberculatus]|uniref:Uncharacterized protein n=1 Tax=Portunus trituberculatus TaxID=210409 RepID=A0A5B7DY56_PORTR|nr:hypothetical protein [Portunus trituberculatus]